MSDEFELQLPALRRYIAFPSEAAGQTVECPHCKIETLHYLHPFRLGWKKEKCFNFAVRTFNRLPGSFTWESDMPSAMLAVALRIRRSFLPLKG